MDTYCLIIMLFAICTIQNNSGVCLFLVREKLRNLFSSPLSYHHSPTSRQDLAPQTQSSYFGAYVQRHLSTTLHSWQQQAGIYFHCSWGSLSNLLALCSAGHRLNDQISRWNRVQQLFSSYMLDRSIMIPIRTEQEVEMLWHVVKYLIRNQLEVVWNICHNTKGGVAIMD